MKRRKAPARAGKHWTSADVATLLAEWHEVAPRTLCQKLRRSWTAVYMKADELRLPRGMPQGFEHLSASARRKGVDFATLRRWLCEEGVRVHRTYPNTRPGVRAHCLYVDPAAVDKALAIRATKEVLYEAAERLFVSAPTLRRLCAAMHGPSPRKAVHPPAYYDAAVAAWRQTPQGRRSLARSQTLRARDPHRLPELARRKLRAWQRDQERAA